MKPNSPRHGPRTSEHVIGKHKLTITRAGGRCYLSCDSWPDIAQQHDGCEDPTAAIDLFEQRATAKDGAA
jgi:hypothetical protein